jgi:hypothetical protein
MHPNASPLCPVLFFVLCPAWFLGSVLWFCWKCRRSSLNFVYIFWHYILLCSLKCNHPDNICILMYMLQIYWTLSGLKLFICFIILGYTAGKHYNHKGSGANNICLPSDPTWLNYVDGIQNLRASVYGSETDIPSSPFFKYAINQQDMPCAVCRSDKSTTLMIPARKNCYPGWTLEYNGYLVGASTTLYFAYEYVCLDKEPDFLDHGASNDDQHVFHLVEGHCGSLPCPPYVDGRELACVVCSK